MSFPRYPDYKDSGVEWLGEVPAHWFVGKVKHITSFFTGWTPPTGNAAFYDGENPWVNISDLGPKWLSESAKSISDSAVDHSGIRPSPAGSLLFSFKLSIGQVSFAARDMYTNEAIATFPPSERLDLAFGYYALPFYVVQNASENIYGAKLLNQELIKAAPVAVPSIDEQQAIATFLDRETAKIDALVAEQQKLIALLQEKRQAVISHAVTKGLDPNVPMKDSGVEWLGEVPGHWDVKRVKHVKAHEPNSFVDGPFGSNLKSEHYVEDGDVYVIESSFATQGVLDTSNLKTISREHFKSIDRSEARAGDIIIAKIGAQFGKCSILPTLDKPAVVSGNSLKLSVNPDVMDVGLMCWQLVNLKQVGAIDLIVNLTAQPALSLSSMNELPILVPPATEQTQIVRTLALKLEQYDTLTTEARTAITLLQERRTALISAAVTGQIDVRGLSCASNAPDSIAASACI